MLELHSDPYKYQKLAFGCMMTKKGEDFHEGGFYVIDQNDKKIDIEADLDIGDYAVIFCTVVHGVDPIDPQKKIPILLGSGFAENLSNIHNLNERQKKFSDLGIPESCIFQKQWMIPNILSLHKRLLFSLLL